ncbi:nuclear transport factor 2 family protein [Nocardia jiangxiensis]|uniref:Nuclear transport factor 2 family protein n=1 Tax=Nocardia jiangxiensis TaxID=282685 RepID=A0ABW6SFF2_9NOCA|nr:nuclear transport factor 2 family protein [Nocardia jiangxiensis]
MSTPETNACRAVVERFYQAMAAGDLETVYSLFAEEAVVSLAGQLEICGTYRGRARIGEWGQAVFGRLDPATVQAPARYTIFAVDPPRVCAMSEVRARAADDTLDYVPTYAQLFEIRDGQIQKFWEFADTAMLEQLFGNRLDKPQAGAGSAFEF